jgi:outer membrane protein assembly factor BamB
MNIAQRSQLPYLRFLLPSRSPRGDVSYALWGLVVLVLWTLPACWTSPSSGDGPTAVEPSLSIPPSVPLRGRQWPDFRGPGGQGHSPATGLPLKWSESENVRWKVAIPGLGWSSPVVWGDQVWMTTSIAEGKSLRAVCVDLAGGQILHDFEVFAVEEPQILDTKNSYASPTPVIEEGRVYVHYGTEGTACISTRNAEIVWSNRSLPVEHGTGPGNSPVLYENLVIINLDGVDVQQVVALNKANGEIVWKLNRLGVMSDEPDKRRAFATPLVVESQEKAILVSPGADQTQAIDVLTGEELWHVRYSGYSLVPRPITSGDVVYICTGFDEQKLWAIRLGGQGLVTDSHLLWERKKQVPRTPSPILVGKAIYMVSDGGILSCLNAETGEERWIERLGGNYSASPIFADGRLFFCSEAGKVSVVEPADEPRIVAVNELEGRFLASPAVVDSSLILRTDTHLYRIENMDRDQPRP